MDFEDKAKDYRLIVSSFVERRLPQEQFIPKRSDLLSVIRQDAIHVICSVPLSRPHSTVCRFRFRLGSTREGDFSRICSSLREETIV